MRWPVVGLLLALTIFLAYNGYTARKDAAAQRAVLTAQTTYLCTAVAALDNVVLAVIPGSRENRPLYEKLIATHIVLSQTQPCQEVAG